MRGLLAASLMGLALVAGCSAPVAAPGAPPAATAESAPRAIAAAPTQVSVPSIRAESSLIPTGLNPDRTIEVPPVEQPEQASWFNLGPTPGSVGPAVILGHINGNHRPGVFADLAKLQPGADVLVQREDGVTMTFVVDRVETHDKDTFPTAEVYGATTERALRLISCGGEYDPQARSYESNVIAFAHWVVNSA